MTQVTGEFPSEEVLLGGICLPTAARAVLPALGLQSLQVSLERCNPTTITPPQTLCQDTVVTQPWACVPPLSTRLMDTKRQVGTKDTDLVERDTRTYWHHTKLLQLNGWKIYFVHLFDHSVNRKGYLRETHERWKWIENDTVELICSFNKWQWVIKMQACHYHNMSDHLTFVWAGHQICV